ncbi:MAG: glycosyltransferase family 39 protein [Pseudomonadota bacterium]
MLWYKKNEYDTNKFGLPVFLMNQHNTPAFPRDYIQKALLASLVILLGIFWLFFFYSVCIRLLYLFELDWIEGEVMCHVIRFLEGKSMYPPPSMEFVAEIYPPFYYLVVALFTKILGVSMLAGRAVSVLACLCVTFMLYKICLKETGSRSLAFICSSFFIALYHIHGPWYDMARVDMLFFALILGGCFVLCYYKNKVWGLSCAVMLLVLGCYTKQNGVIYLGFLALYLLASHWKKGLLFAGLAIVLLAGLFFLLNLATDGWFGQYTFFNLLGYKNNMASALPSAYHHLVEEIRVRLPTEMRYELFFKLPVFVIMGLSYLFYRLISRGGFKNFSLWEYMAIAGALTYFLVRPHPGSEKNDLINLTLWGCILLGMALSHMARLPDRHAAGTAFCTALFLLAVQLCLLLYDPRSDLPYPGSEEKGSEFIARVRSMQGEVYIPYHSFYGVMAGKKMIFNAGAFWGYQMLSPGTYTPGDLIEKINKKYFAAIIIDDTSYYTLLGRRVEFDNISLLLSAREPLSQAIGNNYKAVGRIAYQNIDEFRNPTGFMTRPEIILAPEG